jgi:regulator of ribonuclease activity A
MEQLALADLCDEFGEQVRVLDASIPFRDFGGRSCFSGEVETVKCYDDNSVVKSTLAQPGEGKVSCCSARGARS